MDLYQIRYFLTITETGNFSRAAERLYLSQPSLSTGIKKLEKELGVTLFERGGRRTVLTAAGRSFLKKATVILEQYQTALHELKGFHDEPTLRIGVLSTMQVTEVANLVSTFRAHYPNVIIELYEGNLEQLRDNLEQGEVDVALTVLNLRANSESSVHADPQTSTVLFQQSLHLAVPPNHPLAQRSSIRLEELEGQLFIDRVNCEFFQQECQLLEAANIHPKVVYRANQEEWVVSLIRAGLGISIMPFWRGLTDIVYIPISDLDCQRTIGIRWRPHQDSEIVEQFRQFALSHCWSSP